MPLNLGGGNGSVTYDAATGIFYNNGVAITGLPAYTWAEFNNSGFDLTVARHVKVTDKHSCKNGTSTPGSLWWIDPTAATVRKRNLVSGPLYSATFANILSTFPAATWPGLECYSADIKQVVYSNATNYRLVNTIGTISQEVNGTIASPTKSLPGTALSGGQQLFTLSQPTIPANLVQPGDVLVVEFRCARHGVGSMVGMVALGTSANITDGLVWNTGLFNTDNGKVGGTMRLDVSSNTSFITNSVKALQLTGTDTAGLVDSTTNVNFAADQTFKIGLTVKATNTDTYDLLKWMVRLEQF
jgi:hypothetical protein